MRVTLLVLILIGTGVAADTEIHRCLLEDGTFAFQEMPCSLPAAEADNASESGDVHEDSGTHAVNDDGFDFVNPYDEPASSPMPSETTLPERISQDRAECEKTARDAIDAIDLKLREDAHTKEQGRANLADLLLLTQQLRACKQL
ncbi:MAG TPA: hypothetical protein VF389_08835 [Woeseiaceae bacterium]